MRPTTLVLALCFVPAAGLLIPLASLEAQLQPGQRVRITAPHLGISKHSGILVAVDGDTLTVDTLRVALMNVTRLEVHRGRKSHARMGAVVGAIALGGFGAAFQPLSGSHEGDCSRSDTICLGRGASAAIGAAVGGLFGAVVGALIKTERWEEVPLDRLRVSFGPQRDGRFGLGLSVRF